MVSLSVQGVSKKFSDGTISLRNINFDVQNGKGVVILGHNGSGKSTFFRCISGFEPPTAGAILLNNQDLTKLSKRQLRPFRKKIGMVFQHLHLLLQSNYAWKQWHALIEWDSLILQREGQTNYQVGNSRG